MTKQEAVDAINQILKDNNLSINPKILFAIEDAVIIDNAKLVQKVNFNETQKTTLETPAKIEETVAAEEVEPIKETASSEEIAPTDTTNS